MDEKQLVSMLEKGETQEVEFKESFHSSQDFSKLLSGLANTYGGVILVGVNKQGMPVGLKENLDELQQKISACAQSVSPAILPSIEVQSIHGQKLIAIIVQKTIDGVFHTFQGVIYVKVGSTLKKIEGHQLIDFLRTKQVLSFDESPSNAALKDIDEEKVKAYLSARKQLDYFKFHGIEDFLLTNSVASKNGVLKIKNAALLFFAKNPMFFNKQMELKLVRFDGVEPVKILAHELVQSDVMESIEKALSFVKANVSKSIKVGSEGRHEENFQYPLDVVREAIVNAVAHRNYFSKDAIQIFLFNDRLEITSPGSLPSALPKELFGTISVQRNPITYRLLRDCGYVEGLGSGVPRMIDSMRKHGLTDPEFGIYEHFFRVTIRNKENSHHHGKQVSLSARQAKAVEFLKQNKSIKTKTYMQINNVAYGTALTDLMKLVKLNVLKKIGKYKGAYYVIKNARPSSV